ncbi:hypothetical protein GCM10027299_35130 [Larkinella ripae]
MSRFYPYLLEANRKKSLHPNHFSDYRKWLAKQKKFSARDPIPFRTEYEHLNGRCEVWREKCTAFIYL